MLNQYEQRVALDVVAPDDIPVSFEGESFTSFIVGTVADRLPKTLVVLVT